MSLIPRRNARRRLPQPVKDFVAEGGNVLSTDDDLLFKVAGPVDDGKPAVDRPVLQLRLPPHPKAARPAASTLLRSRARS
jgi:hypothetical protein